MNTECFLFLEMKTNLCIKLSITSDRNKVRLITHEVLNSFSRWFQLLCDDFPGLKYINQRCILFIKSRLLKQVFPWYDSVWWRSLWLKTLFLWFTFLQIVGSAPDLNFLRYVFLHFMTHKKLWILYWYSDFRYVYPHLNPCINETKNWVNGKFSMWCLHCQHLLVSTSFLQVHPLVCEVGSLLQPYCTLRHRQFDIHI